MEYPFGHHHHGHHHRRDDDDDRREEFPPPGRQPPSAYDEPPPPPQVGHVFHTSHVGGPPPMEANYGRPHYPPPPMDDNYGRTNYPPPSMEENYGGSYNRPPPMSDYYDAPPPPQPPPPTSGYSSVQHVSHESESVDRHHDHHRFQPHVPSFFHHQTSDPELMDKPSFRVYTKVDTNYSLTIRDGKVVLSPHDPSDPFQHWYKDEKFSTKVKDEEGFPSFALVNKAAGLALKHSIGASHPVQLTPYKPDVLDASVLWTESRDVGDGYRAVRMVNNIGLNLDAWNADKDHGGVRDGTIVCLWEWWKGDNRNQHWKIVPYSSLVTNVHAKIAEFDAYLEKQALEALNSSLEAYNQNPEEVTNAFNKEVKNSLLKYKSLRRHLKEKHSCMATNPIDRCWRCDKNWAENRKDLDECARGFGHKTTGGKDGRYYVVTDDSDDNVQEPKPGTLRHAVIQEEPLWIIFKKSMLIKLKQELMITSDKTIDGRGVSVHIAYGAGLTIQFVHNVIIHNIRIHHIISTSGGMIRDSVHHIGLRTESDGDGISIFGSNHIWIDHCTLSECTDGLIDAIMASTAITISNCKFNHHNDVMLLGATDAFPQDSIMQVTVAFNRFGEGLIQRMPRCRWGFFHVVNNDYSHWQMYAIGGSAHPTIISQGNRFKAADNPNTKQVTKRDYAPESEWKNWHWVSEGDSFLNGAYFVESGPKNKKKTALTKNHKIKFKPGSHAGRLTRYAGVLKCKIGTPC